MSLSRRSLLALFASVPLLGWLKPASPSLPPSRPPPMPTEVRFHAAMWAEPAAVPVGAPHHMRLLALDGARSRAKRNASAAGCLYRGDAGNSEWVMFRERGAVSERCEMSMALIHTWEPGPTPTPPGAAT